jgi:ATP-binding protein involved in chromosome partitioning
VALSHREQTPARAVIAVASGKGGVGKSTISLNLALALAERGLEVGLLDADFYGPDIPLMVNLARSEPLERWTLWRRPGLRLEPVERFGLKLMSVGFLLAEQQALVWPGQMVEFVGRQLVHDVEWGALDYLVIDLPPGTADVQQQLARLLELAGAIVVVGPQDVAHLDAKRVVDLLRAEDVPVLGAVENMSGLVCPHCGESVDVFPKVRDERSLWALGVPKLASISLDPVLARAGDLGRPIFIDRPDGPQAQAFRNLADAVVEALARRPAA